MKNIPTHFLFLWWVLLSPQLQCLHAYYNIFSTIPRYQQKTTNMYMQKVVDDQPNLYSTSTSSSSSSSDPLTLETDYMGMINFCLRTTDTALSKSSRSKVLNTITNDVFKAIMINNEVIVEKCLQRFDAYDDMIVNSECTLDELDGEVGTEEAKEMACTRDGLTARIYIDWLQKLLSKGITQDNVILGGIYDRSYKRLLTTLKNAGCLFHTTKSNKKEPLNNNICYRPMPQDTNICLSLIDERFPSTTPTRTKELNKLSNSVSRAMLYGGAKEKTILSNYLKSYQPIFAKKWNLDMTAQEVMYIEALSLLLEEGVAIASSAVSSTNSEGTFGYSNISGTINEVSVMNQPHKLRLFDTYLNAFQRVLENCLTEIGMRGGSVPQNEDVLNNFVQWEQSVRRNITDTLWRPNPTELVGKWELIDVRGEGTLSEVMQNRPSDYVGINGKVDVLFKENGVLEIGVDTGVCQGWRFKPGPAHLDTCEFVIQSSVDNDLILKYVGYIDRGQRIESRFSNNPVRMTGRVTSMVRGEVRGSSRFIMVLKRTNIGKK